MSNIDRPGVLCALCDDDAPYGTSRYCYLCIVSGDAQVEEDYLELAPMPAAGWGELDCGGVWDGFQVVSDADPGL